MSRILYWLVVTLTISPVAAAQSDQWRLPNRKANPTQQREPKKPASTLNPIKWAFPTPGLTSVEVAGESYYQLAPEAFGRRRNLGEDKSVETAVILFTPQAIATAKLLQIDQPNLIPDVNRFVAAMAVMIAVEKPADYKNEFIGQGPLFNMQFYFFQTKSGVVGASVSEDRLRVLIVPAPSQQ